jgi:hypothetical protein
MYDYLIKHTLTIVILVSHLSPMHIFHYLISNLMRYCLIKQECYFILRHNIFICHITMEVQVHRLILVLICHGFTTGFESRDAHGCK